MRKLNIDRKEKFLSSALTLFAENGIQNTSTAEIARKAGTAAGTLFLYFPTKQDLINEVVLYISKQQSDVINDMIQQSMSVRDTFFAIWDGSIRWLTDHQDAYQFSQQIRDSKLISTEVSQKTAEYFSFYYHAIQKGLAEGSIKSFPIDLIGGFLYQNIVAVINHIRMHSEPGKVDNAIQQGFELFWDGIRISKG